MKLDIKIKSAQFLIRLGISADLLTVAGLLFSLLAGWLIVQGQFFIAAATLLFSGLLDMLDGAVARLSGKQSKFGGILDSSLDRYGDGFVLSGVLLFYANLYRFQYVLLTLSALLGSFAISYVRARAECETPDCRVGFWERGERLVFVSLALALKNLEAALWILGIGLHWTVLQRLFFAHCQTEKMTMQTKLSWKPPTRSGIVYYSKVITLILLLLFWHP